MSSAGRLAALLVGLAAALVALAVVALFLGAAPVSPGAIVRAVSGRADGASVEETVVLTLRLPRIAVAALAGGALSVAGVAFQALTRNPLAEPSVLGVSSGAAFGVVAAQLFALPLPIAEDFRLTAFAFAGALLAGVVVYLIAATGGRFPLDTLLLAGVIVGVFFSSAIAVLTSLVDVNRLGGVVHWLLGNVGAIPGSSLAVFAATGLAGFWLVARRSRQLNLLALGEEAAAQLGIDAERLKRRIFVGAALLTATVVAFAGPIGFVGLIVPHALRAFLGPDNRLLVPGSMVAGGIFLLAADTLARNIVAPAELSVGVITSLCGAPFFVYVLRRRHRSLA